jgi:hypothetical protein
MLKQFVVCLLSLSAALLTGCRVEHADADLPIYPSLSPADAIDVLARRAAAIHSLTAQVQLSLIRGDRQSIQLDGVMVIAPPNRLRLRVFKFTQAVFDLTVLPDGLWIETSADAAQHGPVIPAALSAGQLAHFLSWFEGGFFTAPGLKTQSSDADTLVFRRDQEDGTAIICHVDHRTATPRLFELLDPAGKIRFSLNMSDYQTVSGIVWPAHLTALAINPTDGNNKIDITFSDIEINGELAPQAFVPPPNAEKRP